MQRLSHGLSAWKRENCGRCPLCYRGAGCDAIPERHVLGRQNTETLRIESIIDTSLWHPKHIREVYIKECPFARKDKEINVIRRDKQENLITLLDGPIGNPEQFAVIKSDSVGFSFKKIKLGERKRRGKRNPARN